MLLWPPRCVHVLLKLAFYWQVDCLQFGPARRTQYYGLQSWSICRPHTRDCDSEQARGRLPYVFTGTRNPQTDWKTLCPTMWHARSAYRQLAQPRHIRLTSQAPGRSPDPRIHRRNRRPCRVTRPQYRNTSTWRLALMSPFSAGVRGLRFANADVLGASVNRKPGSVIW